MNVKRSSWKQSLSSPLAGMAGMLRGGRGRASLALLLAALFFGGARVAWHKWGHLVVASDRYTLAPENIEVTPQPAWIRADVKAEVVRDGSLRDLKILDEQLTLKVANAFAMHTWVANVERVSKHYGPRVVVELQYRQPIAMVEVITDDTRGLLPIDAASVLLPPEDFSPNDVRLYLRIAVGDSKPAGPVGTLWGDERVAGAAKIAAAWSANWQAADLFRIVAIDNRRTDRLRSEVTYELLTRHGRRIIWGHAPGAEKSGEAIASQKISRLLKYVREQGSLDGPGATTEIDLRDPKERATMPSTARLRAPARQ